MSKFKVGERYKVGLNDKEKGSVIEITEVHGENMRYKTISGYDGSFHLFDTGTLFADSLERVHDRYELHITCYDGKTTNAVYKVNGKVVERKQTVCSPKDTFSFPIGAQEAFDRVFPKSIPNQLEQPEPQEDKPKYEVGDKVKVIKNTCYHRSRIGDVLTLKRRFPEYDNSNNFAWSVWENVSYKFIRESDLEPYIEHEQPKEPIARLYCVKEVEDYLTKGNIYQADASGIITYDKGHRGLAIDKPWDTRTICNVSLTDCLVPLVSRPAKVGEWVLISEGAYGYAGNHIGHIFKVRNDFDDGGVYIDVPGKTNAYCLPSEYEVLDGYHPEPEYYNGKVVCVDTGTLSNITVGKVYSVKDGKITHDDGNVSPWFTSGYESVEDLNDKASRYSKAKFIEYKGAQE